MNRFVRRLAHLVSRRRADAELAQEIESHRAMVQDRLESQGLSTEAAASGSRRALGNVTLTREDARSVWIWRIIETTTQDLRIAFRSLRHTPGFTAAAGLTLALGIGVTTAMFAVIQAVLLRPLPYGAPERLAMLWSGDTARGLREQPTSYLTVADWKARTRRFTDLAVFQGEPVVVTGPKGSDRVLAEIVSANLFSLIGVAPIAGRTFSSEEEARAEPVVVISYALWQRQFGGSPDAIGAVMTLQAGRISVQHCRILGVMPATFYFPNKDVQLWRPTLSAFNSGAAAKWKAEPRYRFNTNDWSVVGRLQPGATMTGAQAEMADIGNDLARVHGEEARKVAAFPGFAVDVVPLIDQLTGANLERALWLLFGAVTIVLLITCVNVASLLYARGAVRTREFAIRGALGGSRLRLLRQSVTESVVLAGAAAVLGLLLASGGLRLLSQYPPPGVYPAPSSSYGLTDSVRAPIQSAQPGVPRLDELRIDWRIAAFAAGLSMFTVLVFGLAPSRLLAVTSPRAAFQAGSRGMAGSRSLTRTRHMLVAIECALAVVLLVGAGLLIRTVAKLDRVDAGFNPERVALLRVSVAPAIATIPTIRADNDERRRLFYEQVRARLREETGVEAAGQITDFFSRPVATESVTVPDRGSASVSNVGWSAVDGGFFETINVPLVRGRFFTGLDTMATMRFNRMTSVEIARAKAAVPTIVNQLFADRHLSGNILGQRFGIGVDGRITWHEVVGVVGNMRRDGLDRPSVPEYFTPYVGQTSELVIRTGGDPAAAVSRLREVVRSVDANGIVMGATTLERKIAELDATRHLQTGLLTLFAVLSLLLAAVGIYGTVSYAVTQRTPELGVRMALGARPMDVMAMVLRQGLAAPVAGVIAGLAVAPAAAQLIAHVLFDTSPTDPPTLVVMVTTLGGAALAACVVPALRAARVNPVDSLRLE